MNVLPYLTVFIGLFVALAHRGPGYYEIVDASIATPFAGCQIIYTALVYAASTGQIRVIPDTPWYGTFDGQDVCTAPIVHLVHSSEGLTELQCGTCVVKSGSDREASPREAHSVPTINIPLPHSTDFPVVEFLLRAHLIS